MFGSTFECDRIKETEAAELGERHAVISAVRPFKSEAFISTLEFLTRVLTAGMIPIITANIRMFLPCESAAFTFTRELSRRAINVSLSPRSIERIRAVRPQLSFQTLLRVLLSKNSERA